ncbi:MAG TPA: TRAP transporter TatT component family protein [Desulfomonilia bacterium]|nr:TRAP transporter TatT component family protein [Desulfomonilia bacterium]
MSTTDRVVYLILPLIISASLLGGCASTMAKMTVDGMKPLMEDMRSATNRNSDADLVRAAMPPILIQMDGFIMVSPENRYLLSSAAEANIGYAFLFVEDTDKMRAKGMYYKAREYALRNLALNDTFKQALNQDDIQVFKKALKTIHKRDIAPLYFATNAWLSWINMSLADDPDVLKNLPRVEAMMDRVLEVDDTFYHGGIHALMGVYSVSRPEMFGGQPEQAESHFREAFEISGSKYLLWQFLYAKYYAVQVRDRELFVSTLNKIIHAPDDILPEEAFVNAAVKQKARELLTHVDDYFH